MKFTTKFSRNKLFFFSCGKTMYSQKTVAFGIGRLIPAPVTESHYLALMVCFIVGWADIGIRIKKGEEK